jgi:hypothetical protein
MTADQIVGVARLDAEQAYNDLFRYRVTLALLGDGWHVDFELADQQVNDGGPRCVIDPVSGKITSKRYEQ